MDGVACTVMLDLDAKHPVELAEVCDCKGLRQADNQLLNELFAACSNCAVIHMDCDDCEGFPVLDHLVEYSLVD